MLTTINSNPASVETNLSTALQAAQKLIPASTTFMVGGVNYTQATLVQKIQSLLAPYQAVTALEGQLKQAHADRKDGNPDSVTFLGSLAAAVESLFGGTTQLQQFGFALPKPRQPLTSAQKTASAAKAKLTRQARGTLGKRQKQAIAGVPTSKVVVSTSVSTGSPASPGQPASPAAPVVASAPNGVSSPAAPAAKAQGSGTGTP